MSNEGGSLYRRNVTLNEMDSEGGDGDMPAERRARYRMSNKRGQLSRHLSGNVTRTQMYLPTLTPSDVTNATAVNPTTQENAKRTRKALFTASPSTTTLSKTFSGTNLTTAAAILAVNSQTDSETEQTQPKTQAKLVSSSKTSSASSGTSKAVSSMTTIETMTETYTQASFTQDINPTISATANPFTLSRTQLMTICACGSLLVLALLTCFVFCFIYRSRKRRKSVIAKRVSCKDTSLYNPWTTYQMPSKSMVLLGSDTHLESFKNKNIIDIF